MLTLQRTNAHNGTNSLCKSHAPVLKSSEISPGNSLYYPAQGVTGCKSIMLPIPPTVTYATMQTLSPTHLSWATFNISPHRNRTELSSPLFSLITTRTGVCTAAPWLKRLHECCSHQPESIVGFLVSNYSLQSRCESDLILTRGTW